MYLHDGDFQVKKGYLHVRTYVIREFASAHATFIAP